MFSLVEFDFVWPLHFFLLSSALDRTELASELVIADPLLVSCPYLRVESWGFRCSRYFLQACTAVARCVGGCCASREFKFLVVAVDSSPCIEGACLFLPGVLVSQMGSIECIGEGDEGLRHDLGVVMRLGWRCVGVDARVAVASVDLNDSIDFIAALRSDGVVSSNTSRDAAQVHRGDFSVVQTLGRVDAFGSGTHCLVSPRGVAVVVADAALVVVDWGNHRVVLFEADDRGCAYVRVDASGGGGRGDGEFELPCDTASSGGRVVWVVDSVVCLSVRGRALCAQLRWDRAVTCCFGPYRLALGKRRLVLDGFTLLFDRVHD